MSSISLMPRGTTFTRAAIALAQGGSVTAALRVAERLYGPAATPTCILRDAVSGGVTSGGWADALAEAGLSNDTFVDLVAAEDILGRMTKVRKVPFGVPIGVMTSGFMAGWRGEGKAIPAAAGAFDTETVPRTSVGAVVVLSDELASAASPAGERAVRDILVRAAVESVDTDLIDPANTGEAGVRPAAITAGAPTVASTGDVAADVEEALLSFRGNLSSAIWITHPRTAAAMGLVAGGRGVAADVGARGGVLVGLPLITSESVPSATTGSLLVLADQSALLVADLGIGVDTARATTIELATAPTGDTLTPTAASESRVSLFQTNSVGLKVVRRIGWKITRADAVAVVTDCLYTSGT